MRGQFVERIRNRVSWWKQNDPRRIRGAHVALRNESNTGIWDEYIKTAEERVDNSGKKLGKLTMDPVLGRYCIARESKLRTSKLTKAHIPTRPTTWPFTMMKSEDPGAPPAKVKKAK